MNDKPDIGERTQLFVTLDDKPLMLEGHLDSADDGEFMVTLDEAVEDLSGSSAVLYFPESDRERALTQIVDVQGAKIQCREKRAYPRLFAGIHVRYQSIEESQSADWCDGKIEIGGEWHEADEYMNFSVTGLAFDGSGTCNRDDILALQVSIGADAKTWRASAIVVRAMPLADYEQEALEDGRPTICNIAVSFTNIPEECTHALEDLTNRVLDRV